jgi:hypothetical protein
MNSPTMQSAPAQQPVAGLGALAQPAQQPHGAPPESMEKIMALAKGLTDAQLADVLMGKSLDVPQFAALTEAMGRKSLRTAFQGAQAQQQLNQPSLKQKALADIQVAQAPQTPQAGLDQLPAQNMESMDMAAGGIVAFVDNPNQPVREGMPATDDYSGPQVSGFDKKLWNAIKEKFGEWNQPWGKTVEATPAEIRGAMTGKNPKPDMGAPHPSNVPAPTAEQTAAFMGDLNPSVVTAAPVVPSTKPAGAPAPKTGIVALADQGVPKNQAEQDYLSKLAGYADKQREGLASIKNQGQGEALMQLAAAVMGSPNLSMAASKGLPLVAATAAASRKEQADLNKSANEYDLNLAKARAAVEAGDMDRAYKYKELAENSKYHMAMVNKPGEMMQMLNALKDPEMMKRYQEMNAAKKPMDVVSRKDAMEEFNKYPALKRQYGDFDTYYKTVNNQLLSATIPGQGANIRPY